MTAARLVLWRHGRTEWNVVGRFQGQAEVPLDQVGRQQAAAAAPLVAAFEPVAIFSSDLLRTYQTAEPLAALTGLEIQTDKRLREIHVGSWEGLLGDEIRARDPELAEQVWRGEDVRRSSTGESPQEVADRVAEALTEIAETADDGSTIAVVTHGLAGRVGACRFVGLPFELWRLFGGLANCAWISLDRHRSGAYWRIETYNAVAARDLG
ncbi:MAG TPA: histidine phosphatase family protein [Propionibacteriaceae bacterium]|jgi:probable phosphoglycerate mutase|nr:histidine phosphatase family protein [Propionibacteriaceae bacterium]